MFPNLTEGMPPPVSVAWIASRPYTGSFWLRTTRNQPDHKPSPKVATYPPFSLWGAIPRRRILTCR